MKKNNLILGGIFTLFLIGCTKNEINEPVPVSRDEPNLVVHYEDIMNEDIEADAKHYYRNIIDAIYATSSDIQTRSAEGENPIADKLAALDIEDDKGNSISFYDLPSDKQKLFLERWAKMEAFELSRKIKDNPDSKVAIMQQNKIVDETFDEFGLNSQTRSTGKRINSKAFFLALKEKMVSQISGLPVEEDTVKALSTRSSTYDDVPASRFQDCLRRYGRRGDLLVSLPKHGSQFYLFSYSQKYQNWKVGHAGMLNMTLTHSQYPGNTRFAYAATVNGTEKERIDWWYTKSYIMGLYKIKYRFGGLKREYIRLQERDMEKILWEAERYLGRPYCKDISFIVARLMAPQKFICTTYLWYCVYRAHKIDVSSWWNAFLITPSDIYNSSHTYVKGEIK